MYALLEKWLESFGKWPPMNQMAFSAVLLIAGIVLVAILVYVLYLVLYYLAVACRGWPDETDRPTWKDVAYLNRMMESYRQWEKQQQAKQRPSTKPSSTSSPSPPLPTTGQGSPLAVSSDP